MEGVDYTYTYIECDGMLFVRRQVKLNIDFFIVHSDVAIFGWGGGSWGAPCSIIHTYR